MIFRDNIRVQNLFDYFLAFPYKFFIYNERVKRSHAEIELNVSIYKKATSVTGNKLNFFVSHPDLLP